jgi:tetratricopeptide (TPR) repeat protein
MRSCIAPRAGIAVTGGIAPRFFSALALAALAACSTVTSLSVAPQQPAPAIVSMDEWMARGDAAVQEGDHTKARDAWRSAAKDYPTAKQPWLKLSEDYFNAADYGNAVLAAQEALQRDPHDRLANSVLAVSGLRLTAGSLAALRDDGAYAVGSRDEAVAVTHSLREALGEPVLVPPPDTPASRRRLSKAPKASAHASATADTAAAAPAPAAVAAPVPAPAPAPRTASATPAGGNPLDKLK